jgi:lipase maturation factor 1
MLVPEEEPPTHYLSRGLFLRLLGVIYLVAFASLAVQITGLVGEHGLLPAGEFLAWAHSTYGSEAYRLLPTLFWIGSGDVALKLVAWTGVLLSALLVIGLAPWAMLALLWALYLSLSVVGQSFLSFQWDALLLEAGLLALLWAPIEWWPTIRERAPALLPRWLLVFLLFKLMFLSGLTKLLSGDPTWRTATALDYHFQTQPLPPWTAWYAHNLSSEVHRVATYIMFSIELGAPWLLFAPARLRVLRIVGVAALVLLQVGIAATGNYGFFNALAIVLCVPVLDDRFLRGVLPDLSRAGKPESPGRRGIVGLLTPVFLSLSVLSLAREIAYTLPAMSGAGMLPRWSEEVLAVVSPLRSFNGYGLFRVMTTDRPELVIEGSIDGKEWLEYEFRYKPGSVFRKPGFVAPYHPRLDWQMWFAALDPSGSAEWLQSLVTHLHAGTPQVLALLDWNPFRGHPPRYIRVARYDYRFTSGAERRRTHAWWVRQLVGYLQVEPPPPAR